MTMSFFLKAYLTRAQTSRIAAALVTSALAACASFPATPPETGPVPAPASASTPAREPAPVPAPPPVVTFPAEDELPAIRATGGDPDSVTNVTLQLRAEYGDLWERIRRGFTLVALDPPKVKRAEEGYAARPDYMARMIERSRRYLYYIVTEVEKRGMPLEAALLPMIESAYNPMAYSSVRASGIWQFIPSTGKS